MNLNKIKYVLCGFLTLFVLIGFNTCASEPNNDEILGVIKNIREQWGAPGMAVVVVKGDKIVWEGADGYANIETKTKASPRTVWRIASISKPITATAIMQLAEHGKLNLDDPIWKFLPWYPNKKDNVITVRNILTHTSGIRHYYDNEKINHKNFKSIKDASHIYSVDSDPLQFTPGSQYLYSTYAYALLAGVIENTTGLKFGDYIDEKIFKPAGMVTATLDSPDRIIDKRAGQYRKNYYGVLINAPYTDVSYKWAAGGILASAEDVAKFAIALDTGVLISKRSADEAHASYRLRSGASTDYGLGWHIKKDKQNRVWLYHAGGATGGAAFLLRCPEEGLAVVIVCNLERPGDLLAVAKTIATKVLGQHHMVE